MLHIYYDQFHMTGNKFFNLVKSAEMVDDKISFNMVKLHKGWQCVMHEEFDSSVENMTWRLVHLPRL